MRTYVRFPLFAFILKNLFSCLASYAPLFLIFSLFTLFTVVTLSLLLLFLGTFGLS